MRIGRIILVLLGLTALGEVAAAQEQPVVAMIGTGNLAGVLGPALGQAGYRVIYGSRDPERDVVRALVARTGPNSAAAGPGAAAERADIVILAVPAEVVHDVLSGLGDLGGRIIVDVSAGEKRVAADGYLELTSDSSTAEQLQARHPAVRVVRMNLPYIGYFIEPMLAGERPTVLLAGDDPRAREAVARVIHDLGLDPWDAGPLRFARVFDAINVMALIPAQQGRGQGYELRLMPGPPLSCFVPAPAIIEHFGFGTPYDMDSLPRFPRRDTPVPCDEWRRRLGR